MKNELGIFNDLIIQNSLTETTINAILSNLKLEYRIRNIKLNGKIRTFYIPSVELMVIQEYLIMKYLSKIPVSNFAYAYKRRKSIKNNVQVHKNSNYFFQTDIKNFFPSITSDMITNALHDNKMYFDASAIPKIVEIVSPFGNLNLGSVTSPILSNIVMRKFDEELFSRLQNGRQVIFYSRYSDDITISSERELDDNVEMIVNETLLKYGFRMNDKKTKSSILKGSVKITGLYLTNERKITVGLKYKNKVKDVIYKKLNNIECSVTKDQFLGLISFLKDIEPNYYQKLVLKYSNSEESFIETIIKKYNER